MTSRTGLHLRRRFRRVSVLLAAPLILSLALCQVQGRQFFLSRLWQGVPTSNLSPRPEAAFNLRKVEPGLERSTLTVEKTATETPAVAADVTAPAPVSPSFSRPTNAPLLAFVAPVSGPRSGRSPPR
jgi:hypothetical protein